MSVATTRRFEFVGGSSSKFWEIQTNGCEVIIRFGRIGTSGQSSVKTFPNQDAADKFAAGVIRQKLAKGYHEIG